MSKVEVIKFGSDLIANETGVDRSRIESHVSNIVDIQKLIVVTSGAVATGRAIFRQTTGEVLTENIKNQKYYAGLGCTAVFHAFEEAFRNRNRLVASYPITHQDLEQSEQLLQSVHTNLERNTAVIFNEADAYSQTELMLLKTGGDNDGLASHVADAVDADKLTIITTDGGLVDDEGRLINSVTQSSAEKILGMVARRQHLGNGRGGIATKVAACLRAVNNGIEAIITDETYQRTTRFVLG